MIDFPLGMVRSDVAEITSLGFANLFQAELMAQMALLALANGAIGGRQAGTVPGGLLSMTGLRVLGI